MKLPTIHAAQNNAYRDENPAAHVMNTSHASIMFVVVVISVLTIITIIVLWATCSVARKKYERGQLNGAIWWLKIAYFGKIPVLKSRNQDSVKLVADAEGLIGDETPC